MTESIYEIGFAARIRIDAHSLNNEGTVGNVTEPRTVMLSSGEKTDGISGEMLKHMHSEALWQIVNKDNLCDACKSRSPMRADGNSANETASAKIKSLKEERKKASDKKKKDDYSRQINEELKATLNKAITCPICDSHGFLIQSPALNRKSVVEFGWALALPASMSRTIHLHTRVAAGEKEKEEGKGAGVSEQMIYNRPTRSGIYSFISVFQPWRIGLNEIDYRYAIDEETRKTRYGLVLDGYKAMLSRLEGAMTSTRLPHLQNIEGIIVKTERAMPVSLISPLKDDYIEQTELMAGSQNAEKFDSIASFVQYLDKLKSVQPYRLEAP